MPVQKTDEDELVSVATDLFRRRGYRGTTMAEVGRACGLLKGSLYNYFTGKEVLAVAAMSRVSDYFQDHIFSLASIPDLTPEQKLSRLSKATLDYFTGHEGGCLLANLAIEAMNTEPEFRPVIQNYFHLWVAAYACIYESAGDHPDRAAKRGQDAVARIQGALLLRNVFGSEEPLLSTLSDLSSLS